ncbi:helix-turn-helix transcriptional regulator [Actinophytocola sp.]|jgi:DNA-binding CsgD family transcriptional regulator|uniref:helix-turn-helix transcriptional regulator n=1 Tax=Actinophytocola sp. TaxID=1872138 RepID=UPI002EDB0E68
MTAPATARRVSVLPVRHAAPGASCAGVEALLAAATREVLVMSRQVSVGRDPIGGVRRIDHENVRRGVRYRVLVPDSARTEPVLATRLGTLSLAGADTRTVAEVPTDALVIDGSVVVLPVDRNASGPTTGTAVFRLPSVVTTTTELFERVWLSAVPLTASDLPDSADLGARERELLSLLSAGSTDESAAARLGVSVRTVRRMVADIMNRLGARSRFQAGVKAADRGWLMERAG